MKIRSFSKTELFFDFPRPPYLECPRIALSSNVNSDKIWIVLFSPLCARAIWWVLCIIGVGLCFQLSYSYAKVNANLRFSIYSIEKCNRPLPVSGAFGGHVPREKWSKDRSLCPTRERFSQTEKFNYFWIFLASDAIRILWQNFYSDSHLVPQNWLGVHIFCDNEV